MEDRAAAAGRVQRDVAAMAEYWGHRKLGWLDRAGEEFDMLVEPFTFHVLEVTAREIQAVNGYFTEWVLFERVMRDGMTPLQLYVERQPAGASRERLNRLDQIAQTQFFARFAILEKEPAHDRATLEDLSTGDRFSVFDRALCHQRRWSTGSISERIACVDGLWQFVGQAHLYDVASPEEVGEDGPGAVHPEDAGREPSTAAMSPYVRLLRDVIGVHGRYTPTIRLREQRV